MGWTGIPGAAHYHKTSTQRVAFIKKELGLDGYVRGGERDGIEYDRSYEIVASTYNGTREFFFIIKRTTYYRKPDGVEFDSDEIKYFCLVVLVEAHKDGSLMYKEMSEYCYPYYFPKSETFLLKLEHLVPVPPASSFTEEQQKTGDNWSARRWRDHSYRALMKKKTLNMLRAGQTQWVRADRDITLSNGVVVREFMATRVGKKICFL